jgi:hypothetical protein
MKIKNAKLKDFIQNLPHKLKSPLDNIICNMLESSKYIDGSTIIYDENNNWEEEHYHNWDCVPEEITEIKKQTKPIRRK